MTQRNSNTRLTADRVDLKTYNGGTGYTRCNCPYCWHYIELSEIHYPGEATRVACGRAVIWGHIKEFHPEMIETGK